MTRTIFKLLQRQARTLCILFLGFAGVSGVSFAYNPHTHADENEDTITTSASASRRRRSKEVDLSSLNNFSSPHEKDSDKRFRAYFDFALYSRPGLVDLTFGNFHSFVFLEVMPTAGLSFQADVVSAVLGQPSYFQVDWEIKPWITIQAGKIWVPFDDLSPHHHYGGRVGVTTLQPAGSAYRYLPNLWTDHGINFKWTPIDRDSISLQLDTYVINGFASAAGVDPNLDRNDPIYPDFSDKTLLTTDNNYDKAVGTRAYFKFYHRLGVGASFQTGRWSNQDDQKLRYYLIGGNVDLKLKVAELRVGASNMWVELPSDTILRGGFYGEVAVPIKNWKILARGGSVQMDNTVKDITDQVLVGGSVRVTFPFVEFSVDYSKDLVKRVGKRGEDFIGLRALFMI